MTQPQYGSNPYGGQPYPQQPYPQQNPYGPPPPGYGGYGYPQPAAKAKMTDPVIGWLLLVAGAIVAVGSVTPWATVDFLGVSKDINGTDGDGVITVVFGIAVAVLGLLIGLKLGRVWVGIVALVIAALTSLTAVVDLGSVNGNYGKLADADIPDDVVNIGWGLWLVLAGGILGVVLGIVAIVRRS